jgi:hypothetical protein
MPSRPTVATSTSEPLRIRVVIENTPPLDSTRFRCDGRVRKSGRPRPWTGRANVERSGSTRASAAPRAVDSARACRLEVSGSMGLSASASRLLGNQPAPGRWLR